MKIIDALVAEILTMIAPYVKSWFSYLVFMREQLLLRHYQAGKQHVIWLNFDLVFSCYTTDVISQLSLFCLYLELSYCHAWNLLEVVGVIGFRWKNVVNRRRSFFAHGRFVCSYQGNKYSTNHRRDSVAWNGSSNNYSILQAPSLQKSVFFSIAPPWYPPFVKCQNNIITILNL